jgi:hypothetical protein
MTCISSHRFREFQTFTTELPIVLCLGGTPNDHLLLIEYLAVHYSFSGEKRGIPIYINTYVLV